MGVTVRAFFMASVCAGVRADLRTVYPLLVRIREGAEALDDVVTVAMSDIG